MGQPRYRLPDEDDRDGDLASGKMGFLDHLDELRTRLIYSCVAIAAGMVVSFLFIDRIADFVLAAAMGTLPADGSLITTRPGEGLSFYLDLALMGGVIVAAPFVSYQVWRFVAPGLYAREKRLVVPFVGVAVAGTLAGAAFSHYLLFPSMMAFFGTFGSPRIRFMPRLEDTFELYRNTLIGMVAVFQIPTLVFFLSRMRLVTAAFLWRHIKYAVLAIFVVAAVLTPSPDPWNQAVFAAPMIGLYVISIGVAWLVAPRRHDPGRDDSAPGLKLVFAAAVIDHARRRRHGPGEFPRRVAERRSRS
jgi:sec-independent protein translocase protein TatC